ncbi:MAG: AMP-binding protein, partial [Deltaproteobacteria bacterium]|nr:AMP-binding protein [Deltaproteobacteria bacterium]
MPIIWKPSKEHLTKSNIARFMRAHSITDYDTLIKKCSGDIEWFWDTALKDLGIQWDKPYTKILEGNLPFANWFIGGKINIVTNCLDRHQKTDVKNKTAFIWEGDCGAVKKVSYAELFDQVNRLASGMKKLGIGKGDAVGIYMPMIPEMMTAFFATLKLGAVVVPIFSGFGPEPASVRLDDAKAKLLFTADGGLRRGKKIAIKQQADEAVNGAPSVKHVVVAKRLFEDIPWTEGRDIWFEDLLNSPPLKKGGRGDLRDNVIGTESLAAEDRSIIIYTSGTTGKPKGTVHTHAGCLAQMVKEVAYYMDCKKED